MGPSRVNRCVVTDTGPLIHLNQAEAKELIELTGEILVPRPVLHELEEGPTDVSDLDCSVGETDQDEAAYPQLDAGETAALLLSIERDAILLTDDLDARPIANDEGIEVHGSLGVILHAFSHGVLSGRETKHLLRDLKRDTNLYLSDPLIEHAIGLVEGDDAGW